MSFFDKFSRRFNKRYNKTNFKAGDLILEDTPLTRSKMSDTMIRNEQFIAPRKIDNRDLCLASSNQLQTPHCAGYSTAGYIEVQNWKKLHYPQQVNGDAIYKEAKTLDNFSGDGTYLWAAIKGAEKLGMIKGSGKSVKTNRQDIQFALHEYTVCLAGFMITDDWNYVDLKNGIIKNSGRNAKPLGGHAILLCGYDDVGVYIQNSWGTTWGVYGFAILGWEQFDSQLHSAMVVIPPKCAVCGN